MKSINCLKILTLVLYICFTECANSYTNFVDKQSKVKTYAESEWFINQIPFIEVPNTQIEQVYYYRWSLLKRHIRYTQLGSGYVFTEFVLPVGYSQKFDTIVAAAGHHINEAKWLRNRNYAQDYINFWSREGGATQQYSEWIAESAWNTFGITGDKQFIVSQKPGLVRNYNLWANHYESSVGLYHISPLWDAQEYSCASMPTKDQFGGGVGYRPSFNAEMYANAESIAIIAAISGDSVTEKEFRAKASALRQSILKHLWDPTRKFFYHMQRDNNTEHVLIDSREEVGFYPFRFNVPDNESYAVIWQQLHDTEGFNASYGPPTCEVRSKWYDGKQKWNKCCYWNGNSWPYSTALTLGAIANTINNYKQTVVNKYDYYHALSTYAKSSYKNGKPYVAECHSPETDVWVCDSENHSEHYLHSTYVDNVLGELIGIKPRSDNAFELNPLIPDEWDYFIVENLAYHAHNVTVLFDKTGNRYKSGQGLKVYIDGQETASSATVTHLIVNITEPKLTPSRPTMENYAANAFGKGYPKPSASFTSDGDSVWNAIDGRVIYDYIPRNRWANWQSHNTDDWFALDFGPGRDKTVNEVRLYIYSDVVTGEGKTDCPESYKVQYYHSNAWIDAENQHFLPEKCSPNDVNVITFTPVKTQQLRVVFKRNVAKEYYIGLTEIEVWSHFPQTSIDNTYEAEDGLIINSDIRASSTASSGSYVGGIDADDASVEISGVWTQSESKQKLRIYYCSISNATHHLTVNNLVTVDVNYPKNCNSWGVFNNSQTYVEIAVSVLTGRNSFVFKHVKSDLDHAELDKIQLIDV